MNLVFSEFFLTQSSHWVNHLSVHQSVKLLPCSDVHLICFTLYRFLSANVISGVFLAIITGIRSAFKFFKSCHLSFVQFIRYTIIEPSFFQSRSKIHIHTSLSLFPAGKWELFVKVIKKD